MNTKTNLGPGRMVCWMATALVIATTIASAKAAPLMLGPAEAGTWSGSSKWLTGAYGTASTFYDFKDTAGGVCAFAMSNSVAGPENAADWRCEPFSLGPAAGGARPITFSFAYKLADPVAAGNNIRVSLRFYDSTGTNFISERTYPVGARMGDSAMSNYRTLTMNGILAPRKARTADISINMDAPWTSGTGRFDDFTVTTVPRSPILMVAIGAAMLLAVAGVAALLLRRRRAT